MTSNNIISHEEHWVITFGASDLLWGVNRSEKLPMAKSLSRDRDLENVEIRVVANGGRSDLDVRIHS